MFIADCIEAQLPGWRDRVQHLRGKSGDFKVCDVTVSQIYSGIRGVQIQVSDISYVDPYEGLRLRGYTIPELLDLLPKAAGSPMPLAGGLYYLLLCDALPTRQQAEMVEEEWRQRSEIPAYVCNVIRRMPAGTHPMTLFSMGIMALQRESVFAKKYDNGTAREDHWRYYLEDALNLTAKLPGLAAFIYNLRYQDGITIPPDPDLDWSANFAHMIDRSGNPDYHDLCRLFFFLHSDHEGGNVSAHATHLISSALSDVYLSCAGGMNGLAGPLHGLANQECLKWLLDVQTYFGKIPSQEDLRQYLIDQLRHGALIPGYGHAVLRTTDPRFTAQLAFARKYMPSDELLQLVDLVYQTLPDVLQAQGKVSNPWPNVDAINGALQYHFGVKEFDFYTVLFGVSRIMGLTAHIVWARALLKPIERPKSLTTEMLETMIRNSGH
ncbi:MAG TPA: citrate (Si)-synthase [Anaerolineaceae bacterium]|nr:citrate (Si)-synthase [Anaerolineaceae bacterium]HPN51913.1 citrate (Si)-synthase [Anaerolineaceae bacterium]